MNPREMRQLLALAIVLVAIIVFALAMQGCAHVATRRRLRWANGLRDSNQ